VWLRSDGVRGRETPVEVNMERLQYGKYDAKPPELVTVVLGDDNGEVLSPKGEEEFSTRSEAEIQFRFELLLNTWPAGTHICWCGPGEQRFDAVV
jgi:hypothetical protein